MECAGVFRKLVMGNLAPWEEEEAAQWVGEFSRPKGEISVIGYQVRER